MDPSPGAVAVVEARNISGGVNPPMTLPAAPQPFWLEGPLEPPCGRTDYHFARSREIAEQVTFTIVNTSFSQKPKLSGDAYC